jgi:hypothetical protein
MVAEGAGDGVDEPVGRLTWGTLGVVAVVVGRLTWGTLGVVVVMGGTSTVGMLGVVVVMVGRPIAGRLGVVRLPGTETLDAFRVPTLAPAAAPRTSQRTIAATPSVRR